MNFNYRIILKILLACFVSYLVISISISLIFGHKARFGNCEKYMWLINKDYISKIDTRLCVENYRDFDSYFTYKLKDYYIGIIEIKDLHEIQLPSIDFNNKVSLDNEKFYPADILNSELAVGPVIRIRWRLPFRNHLSVNFNEKTEIIEKFTGENYIGFYGKINNMSFSNERGKNLFFFDFRSENDPTLLVFKKTRYKLYIIMVNSEDQFGIEAKNILKLK